ncbi:glycosyltransferase family 2 protein [Paenibacillus polygoni]|uniref:Glycosyltransferase family 2 protein n=1 Tax=Paenibacillus polygoni TaxID=3050112 RepID=A0ABY8X5P7_9BACL|nr:glycosyltransferase family 2 protein [Paenibacillus polygoni]WIV20009.1 glycosyltransferase family 2 protein [Paenibacillus polygoni]
MCRVSIIIAAYNAERFITRAVTSIQNQTYQDFEIIICDDSSTDKTVEVVKNMMENDHRIRLLRNTENLKAAATRNKCINEAKGEYIAIQDADDFSHKTRLEEQVYFLDNNNNYGFVSSKMFILSETDNIEELSNFSPDSEGLLYKLSYISSPDNKDFLYRLPYTHASTMFRKNVINDIGGYRVAKETVRGEDSDLFMRLHAKGNRGYNLNKALYYYLEGEDAYKRKKYRYRIHSAINRYKGFKAMGLLPRGYIFLLKPLIVGLIPLSLLRWYRNKH